MTDTPTASLNSGMTASKTVGNSQPVRRKVKIVKKRR